MPRMSDTKPFLHTGTTPIVPVPPPPPSRLAGAYTPAYLSQILRVLTLISTQFPHLFPSLVGHAGPALGHSAIAGLAQLSGLPLAGVVLPLMYLYGLPGWLGAVRDSRKDGAGPTGPAGPEATGLGTDEMLVQEKTYAPAV